MIWSFSASCSVAEALWSVGALKVEGILECAELFVVALGDGREAHVCRGSFPDTKELPRHHRDVGEVRLSATRVQMPLNRSHQVNGTR